MMYFKFENGFESFKLLFGKRMTNNGNSVRQNGILLSFLKNEFKRKNFSALGINSMTNLYLYIMNQLYERTGEVNVCLKWGSNTLFAYSPDYHTDKRRGFCEDYDSRSVRYVRNDNEKVYKMKAGKFMRHLLMNNPRTSGSVSRLLIMYAKLSHLNGLLMWKAKTLTDLSWWWTMILRLYTNVVILTETLGHVWLTDIMIVSIVMR